MARTPPALVSLLLLASTASAQDTDIAGTLRLVVDNDLFAVNSGLPDDHDYTHGTRLHAASAGAPRWLRSILRQDHECRSAAARRVGCVATSFELAQEIYTPRVDGTTPVPGERPYTGWLYASTAAHVVIDDRVRSLRVDLGVTGPPSLAEQAQDGIHALLGEHERRGWAHQLEHGIRFAVAYDERHALARRDTGSHIGSFSVEYGGSAGNVRAEVHMGVLARVGTGRRVAWSPVDLDATPASGYYALAGVRQYLVFRDLFVEGTGAQPGAERLPMVQELVLGLGARHRRIAVEYRHVLRGREYEAQPEPHAYGSVAVTIDRL